MTDTLAETKVPLQLKRRSVFAGTIGNVLEWFETELFPAPISTRKVVVSRGRSWRDTARPTQSYGLKQPQIQQRIE